MERGVVKVWLADRGFGFITDAAGLDVFVHASQLPRGCDAPATGQPVTFRRGGNSRGPVAQGVTLVSGPEVITVEEFAAEFGESFDWDTLVAVARRHGWLA